MTIPSTMYGVVLTGHGGPEMLEFRDNLEVPLPGPNDVIIRVNAAGVNNTDINTRTAWYSKGDADEADAGWSGNPLQLPRVQGADVCGQIISVGSDVAPTRLDERV